MKKRWISLLLVFAMVMAMVPQVAIEARAVQSGTCGENLTWVLTEDGMLTISGSGPMTNYANNERPWYDSLASIKTVIIEEGVTSISYFAFYDCRELTSVTIPNSVTSIGYAAFQICSNLPNVSIPDSVTTIGDYAFDSCRKLTSITIPANVTYIGDCAFSGCEAMTGIYVDASNPVYSSDGSGVLFNKDRTELLQAPGTIEEYIIPSSVTSINYSAFADCRSLVRITIPYSVTTIGDYAFEHCKKLTSVTIPINVTDIGYSAFADCTSMTGIYVDTENPYYSCDSYGVLFNKQHSELIEAPGAIQTYAIPDNVTSIGDRAFAYCRNLTNVTIPDSVTSIGLETFILCHSLTSVIIPRSISSIGEAAFWGCYELSGIYISDNLTSIADYAFLYCYNLKDVYYSGTEQQWENIYIGDYNDCLTNATIHFESEMPDESLPGYQMHAYGSCRDSSISRGEEMTVVVALCKDGIPVSDWNTPVYTIDDHSYISVTKSEKKGDYVYLTVRGVREGKTILTVTDSDSGAYVALEITVRDSDAIPSCFFITDVPRFYPDYLCERNNLTNFYNFNGLYVCDFPLPENIQKINGEYTLSFTVYNSTHMYGSVDIFDAQGNWKGCERINKHTKITGLWDTAKSAFFLIRDLVSTDILSYNAASFSTPTKITVTVPEGGYITISNNFVESQGTYIYNTVDFLMLGVSLTMDLALGKYELEGVQEQAVNQILQTPDSYKTFLSYYPEIGANIIADLDEKGYGAIVESITLQSFELFDEMDFDFLGTVDSVLDSAGNVAEDIYVKCTPIALGAALKGMFAVNGALDRLYQAMDISRSENKPYIVLYTPEASGGLTMSGVTVTPDGNSVPDDAVLQVFRIGNTDAMVISDAGLVVSQYELYNICFTVNNEEVQPNGMVTVKIPIPENFVDNKCIVFHQQDNGQWSKVDCWIENGFIVFEVDHFSQFALVDMSTSEPYVCPFTDVPAGSFYYEPVLWAVEEGITSGTSADTFSPSNDCLRAQVVTFLWRAAGEPEPTSERNPFVDVKPSDFYYKAVLWAVENNITNGADATHFNPMGICNRAQVVTFLYRAFRSPAVENTDNPFTDVPEGSFYRLPVLWAVENGITNGLSVTQFGPNANCNRAQIVTFLYRAYN